MLARDMIIEIEDPNVGRFKAFGFAVKFIGSPGYVKKASPLLGVISRDVLEEAGYSQEEIEKLITDEIIGVPETAPAE